MSGLVKKKTWCKKFCVTVPVKGDLMSENTFIPSYFNGRYALYLTGGRACYVLECGGGLAQDVITTIGQAFELR